MEVQGENHQDGSFHLLAWCSVYGCYGARRQLFGQGGVQRSVPRPGERNGLTYGGPLLGLWASAVPIGAILAGVGMLSYVRAQRSRIWQFALGVFAVLLVDILSKFRILLRPAHSPPLFGIGGGLILACFVATLWFWAKKRATLDGATRMAADLQLTGYVFLFAAMWYLCGDLSRPYQKALLDLPLRSPVSTIVYLVLGWLFLSFSHYGTARMMRESRQEGQ